MRVLFTSVLFCLICASAQAQLLDHFRHSVGLGVSMLQNKEAVSPAFGLYYNPQLNYLDKFSDFSMSVAMPVIVGGHIETSIVDTSFFFAQVPLVTEVNIGHYATRDFTNSIGMSFGGGYAMQVTNRGLGHGPVVTASFRTWIKHASITVRYIGMFQFTQEETNGTVVFPDGYNSHSIALALNLGQYLSKVRQMNKISKWMNPFRN